MDSKHPDYGGGGPVDLRARKTADSEDQITGEKYAVGEKEMKFRIGNKGRDHCGGVSSSVGS